MKTIHHIKLAIMCEATNPRDRVPDIYNSSTGAIYQLVHSDVITDEIQAFINESLELAERKENE